MSRQKSPQVTLCVIHIHLMQMKSFVIPSISQFPPTMQCIFSGSWASMFKKVTSQLSIIHGYPKLAIRLSAAVSFSSVLSLSGWWFISTNRTIFGRSYSCLVLVATFCSNYYLSRVTVFGARASEELFFWPFFFFNLIVSPTARHILKSWFYCCIVCDTFTLICKMVF